MAVRKPKGPRGISNEAFGQMVGVSARAVDKAGPLRVVRFPDGSIDSESSLVAWEQHRSRAPGPGRGHGREIGEVVDWKDKREMEAYRKLRLERRTLQGKLVPIDVVESERAETGAKIRARLEGIPPKLCDRLAASSSPTECREMVAAEVRLALEELANRAEEVGDDG